MVCFSRQSRMKMLEIHVTLQYTHLTMCCILTQSGLVELCR